MFTLQPINLKYQQQFLEAVERSKQLHHPWVSPPCNEREFAAYLKKFNSENNISLLVFNNDSDLMACINLNEIVRGVFQSAYLGYYAFQPFAGKGNMFKSMQQVIAYAFNELGLHRVEANIQPENTRSINLVKALNFRLEGFSPNYIRIGHQWKDHQRFAITVEDINQSTS